jgi:hypothetical protein
VRWLIATVLVVGVVGAAVAAAFVVFARSNDQGLVPDRIQRAAPDPRPSSPSSSAPAPPPARCPAGVPGCREVSGRIAYVERVDPDGDGDAHFVLADPASLTGPGITVVDVRADLRPQPLPGVGDALSAAGPLATGSFGQRQIEAVAVQVGR